jgi:hypothetical protein
MPALAALAFTAALAPGMAWGAAARFAVVVGSNAGAAGRPRLWFAERDAEQLGRTLVELSDFSEDRVILLRGPAAARVREAIAATEARIALARQAGDHPLFLFYFSGHASAGGLEIGSERLPFDELRALVASTSAGAKIAVVDACEAGVLTQVKGATAAPALDFPLPADDSVRGTAFIASTAVGETAQESAAIGGSFFTHHLEVALRGAGDADRDGLVTLAEAFRYTAAQTLAGTVATSGGAQHATYDFKMAGRGDVVLSDLRRSDARLTLPRDPGSSYVLRGPLGILAEVAGAERSITLALPAGRYEVERLAAEGRATADLTLDRGATRDLPPLAPTRYELARTKGGPKPGLIFAGMGGGTLGLANLGLTPDLRLGVRKELGAVGLRVRIDYMGKSAYDQGITYGLTYYGAALGVLHPVNAARVLIEAGPEIGYGYASQTFANRKSFGSGVLWAGAAAMATAPVGPFRLGLDAAVGLQRLRLNGSDTLKPAFSAAALALWGF